MLSTTTYSLGHLLDLPVSEFLMYGPKGPFSKPPA